MKSLEFVARWCWGFRLIEKTEGILREKGSKLRVKALCSGAGRCHPSHHFDFDGRPACLSFA